MKYSKIAEIRQKRKAKRKLKKQTPQIGTTKYDVRKQNLSRNFV